MSTSEKTATTAKMDAPLIHNRFALRRKMASTALADVYWADDLHTPKQGEKDHIVLLILVTPSLSTLPNFAQAWKTVLARPAPPSASYPSIVDWGIDGNNYWYTCANTQGSLLTEYLDELGKQSVTPEQALSLTQAVSQALSNAQAGAFGYFELGTTLKTDQSYILLNAPIAKALHSLLLQQTGLRQPLALHSAWLSPSVAVGDLPVTEDDTFSMASLYHLLLTRQAPYSQQSTLTALARGTAVAAIPKLKPEHQQLLNQSLSLQRNQRAENPEALLNALGKKNYKKVLLPLAALAAAGVVVYAGQHLFSKFNDILNEPSPTTQTLTAQSSSSASNPSSIVGQTDTASTITAPALSIENPNTPTATEETVAPSTTNLSATNPSSPTEEITNSQSSESTVPVAVNTTENTVETPPAPANLATTSNAESSPSTEMTANPTETSAIPTVDNTALILKATEALNAGKVTGADSALSILREAWTLNRQDPNARALLDKIIAQQQQQTASQINLNKTEEAKQVIAQTDDIIREFGITDRIAEQVRLESLIEIREREQREAAELIQQAKAALKRGNLSKADSNENALSYLDKLMFILPNHSEGRELLSDVVKARQEQIKNAVAANKLTRAGTYLDETSRLIRKYNLTAYTKTQAMLEQDYRQAIESVQAAQAATEPAPPQVIENTLTDNSPTITTPVVEGERYVTPNDDLTILNQQPAEVVLEPQTPREQQHTEQAMPAPTENRVINEQVQAPSLIEGGPAQIEQVTTEDLTQEPQVVSPASPPRKAQIKEATEFVPEQTTIEPQTITETAITVPAALPVESGVVNQQGILETQTTINPPVAKEEKSDSELK